MKYVTGHRVVVPALERTLQLFGGHKVTLKYVTAPILQWRSPRGTGSSSSEEIRRGEGEQKKRDEDPSVWLHSGLGILWFREDLRCAGART